MTFLFPRRLKKAQSLATREAYRQGEDHSYWSVAQAPSWRFGGGAACDIRHGPVFYNMS
jgi:hypothetical protein